MCRFNKGGLSKKTYMAKSRSRQKNQFSLKKILRQIKFCRSFFRAHTHAHETHSSKPLIPAASAHRNCTFPCKLRRVSFQQITSIHLCLNLVERYTGNAYCPDKKKKNIRGANFICRSFLFLFFLIFVFNIRTKKWRTRRDSNPRPLAPEASALSS